MADKSVYLIPAGPKNLTSLFPTVDFNKVTDYYIEVKNDSGTVVATSPGFNLDCCPEDKIRIHFLNYLGTFDAVNFFKPKIIHQDTSSEYQNALSYPLQKQNTGIERMNVKGNDTYEAKLNCNEEDMPWLQECADSPKLFIEWPGIEGQPDDFIPVVKIAGKFDKMKNDFTTFRYEFIIQFRLSNEYITIRN